MIVWNGNFLKIINWTTSDLVTVVHDDIDVSI